MELNYNENEQDENSLYLDENEDTKKKPTKLSDIVTVQCIICILIVIAYLVFNLLNSEYTDSFTEIYKKSVSDENDFSGQILSVLSDNIIPNDNV